MQPADRVRLRHMLDAAREARAEFPELPWPDIAGMRHRLIHAYFDVDFDRVWDTVVDDLPPLIEELEALDLDAGS